MVVRVLDGRLLEDWLVDGLVLVELGRVRGRGGLVELGLVELGRVRGRGGLVKLGRMGCRGRLVVLHVEEPLRGVVLVLVQGAGGGVEGGGGVAAKGDRLVRVHL